MFRYADDPSKKRGRPRKHPPSDKPQPKKYFKKHPKTQKQRKQHPGFVPQIYTPNIQDPDRLAKLGASAPISRTAGLLPVASTMNSHVMKSQVIQMPSQSQPPQPQPQQQQQFSQFPQNIAIPEGYTQEQAQAYIQVYIQAYAQAHAQAQLVLHQRQQAQQQQMKAMMASPSTNHHTPTGIPNGHITSTPTSTTTTTSTPLSPATSTPSLATVYASPPPSGDAFATSVLGTPSPSAPTLAPISSATTAITNTTNSSHSHSNGTSTVTPQHNEPQDGENTEGDIAELERLLALGSSNVATSTPSTTTVTKSPVKSPSKSKSKSKRPSTRLADWSSDEVTSWIRDELDLPHVAKCLQQVEVTGYDLLSLQASDLNDMALQKHDVETLLSAIKHQIRSM